MLSAFCHAQEVDSMRSVSLDSVVVSARRNTSGMAQRADGMLVWKMQNLLDMPKILGNADPIHFAQMLPGIQTNTEFRCGINIEGCDNTHNVVEIGGVPVYNASHLLGLFSVFNASHYQTMNVAKTPLNAANAARIGGTLSFEPFYVAPDSTQGEASVGLISSQATVRTRLGSRTTAPSRCVPPISICYTVGGCVPTTATSTTSSTMPTSRLCIASATPTHWLSMLMPVRTMRRSWLQTISPR